MGELRRSRLRDGVALLHADLHNHTQLSDGDGDPERAFELIRAAGLDVAAITDHASIPEHHVPHLDPGDYPHAEAFRIAHLPPRSIEATAWETTARIADAADRPGEFTALRGFEWTEPYVGHANVWFSDGFRDVHTPGRMSGLHDWLLDTEPTALFGYNHPGREGGRFGDFVHDERLGPRMVAFEIFNRYDDYVLLGDGSPLVDCLATGWRPGLVGVSDEHGRSFGLAGKGRTGIWAAEHSRAGVRAALAARATYATREVGLVLDALLGGRPAGGEAPAEDTAELAVDLRAEGHLSGREVRLEVLAPDPYALPVVVAELPATVGKVTTGPVRLSAAPWHLLRVADPARVERRGSHRALAYASPWWTPSPRRA